MAISIRTTIAALLLLASSGLVAAQQAAERPAAAPYSYPDVADLALASSVVAHVKIRRAERLAPALAAGIGAGKVRFLVTADVVSLIRGKDGVTRRISFLADLPLDSRGRAAKLEKAEKVVFAVAGQGDQLRLARPDAMLDFSPTLGLLTRDVVTETLDPAAPPKVTGVAAAFHSEGVLPGEGETQIFLNAEGDRPVSLTVVRAPNARPRWYVSLGEVVDQASGPPKRDTLLWYRLACALPKVLPQSAVGELRPDDAVIAREDYATVTATLGACVRKLG